MVCRTLRRRCGFLYLAIGILTSSLSTLGTAQSVPAPASIVGSSLSVAEDLLDFASAKLAFDRIVDPSIKTATFEKEVARLANEANNIVGPRASDGAKIDAVRKVLYEAGPWNDHRPFSYDHTDPLGQNIQNKLLSTYLLTRRGNCVTMPTLFMIVGRRLGLNLTLSTAPLHVLVRYTRPGIHPFNIEATSGGSFARDEWYRQQFPMSERAIESGLYLRTHSDRQTVAVMATTVLEYLIEAGRNEEAVGVADAILSANPKDGFVMAKKGTAIGQMMKVEFFDKYPTPALVPVNLRKRYAALAAANQKAFADAETLGWEEPKLSAPEPRFRP